MKFAKNWLPLLLASATLLSGCAQPKLILTPVSQPPLPRVSVDMPRPPEVISSDVEQTLRDLDSRLLQRQQLLTP